MTTKTKYYVTALHGGLQIRDRESGADVPCDLGMLEALGVAAKYDAALEIARLLNEAVEAVRLENGKIEMGQAAVRATAEQWAYSTNEEDYTGGYASRAAAISAAMDEIGVDQEEGDEDVSIRTARAVEPVYRFDAQMTVEMFEEAAEEWPEAAEPMKATREQWKDLSARWEREFLRWREAHGLRWTWFSIDRKTVEHCTYSEARRIFGTFDESAPEGAEG